MAHAADSEATLVQTRPTRKDRLEEVEGIGPVYAKRLNEAGIFLFAQLAELSADRVREIINPEEWQKIEPESWIAQARVLANPDHLEDINGIGEEYAQRLNQAGIYTFAQLVEAGPERLRQIIDPEKWQKIEPERWIAEARQFAAQKSDQAAKGA
jgi:predicted flap endonuclease-1-like 5' DNA nuclease